MKTRRKKSHLQRGSVLTVALITCAILSSTVGSYLYLTETQHRSVVRSQDWNQALVVAEGGVEEAMAFLNSGIQWPNPATPPFWTSAGPGGLKNNTSFSACKFGTSYYQVTMSNVFAGSNVFIYARGYVPGPSGSSLTRIVRVGAQPRLTFPVKAPMIVMQSYNANGNNVNTDSFDSTKAPYNPATAGTNGDVVCFTTNANSIAIGNGNVHGSVRTPPGGKQGVTATIGSNGSVGDAAWVDGGSKGFETGHFRDDFSMAELPDAAKPNVAFLPALVVAGKAPDGLTYDTLLPSGNWQISSLTGSLYVGQSNTVLYVTGNINISGSGTANNGVAAPGIYLAPGASLTIYMAGASTSISGNGIANTSGDAKRFAYYGLPSNTSISLSGNSSFFGSIYAPEADFYLKGGGNTSTNDFTGSSITKTTTMGGNYNFHYDEGLGTISALGGYDPISWQEL
jgi:hypothetical protein